MTPIEQVRESVTHELKCWIEQFRAVKRGEKTFEFRKDDRDYRVGDTLHLHEWYPSETPLADAYTGDECHRKVTYIIREGFGIPKGYCIMSLALLKTMEGEPTHSLYENGRQKAQEWAEQCWPINGELLRKVHHELMRQAFMQGYERRLQEDRRRAMDKRGGS